MPKYNISKAAPRELKRLLKVIAERQRYYHRHYTELDIKKEVIKKRLKRKGHLLTPNFKNIDPPFIGRIFNVHGKLMQKISERESTSWRG